MLIIVITIVIVVVIIITITTITVAILKYSKPVSFCYFASLHVPYVLKDYRLDPAM